MKKYIMTIALVITTSIFTFAQKGNLSILQGLQALSPDELLEQGGVPKQMDKVYYANGTKTTLAEVIPKLKSGQLIPKIFVDANGNYKVLVVKSFGETIDIPKNVNIDYEAINKKIKAGKHYIGELFGGGIIFWLNSTDKHGLIASLDDIGSKNGIKWSPIPEIEIEVGASSITDGKANTAAILKVYNSSNAAALCNNYSNDGFSDWYLPAKNELKLLGLQSLLIEKILDNDKDEKTNGFGHEKPPTYRCYWSSTEKDGSNSFICHFHDSLVAKSYKSGKAKVRAIRAF